MIGCIVTAALSDGAAIGFLLSEDFFFIFEGFFFSPRSLDLCKCARNGGEGVLFVHFRFLSSMQEVIGITSL